MKPKEVNSMLDEMGKVDGVSFSMSLDTLIGPSIPREIVPESVTKILKSDKWQLMLVGSEYKVASDEENAQIDELSKILKSYDKDGMLIGEAAATKDLIDITDQGSKYSFYRRYLYHHSYCTAFSFTAYHSGSRYRICYHSKHGCSVLYEYHHTVHSVGSNRYYPAWCNS